MSTFYSQCGEDEFLSEYIETHSLNITKTFVEIGAGRPEEISNSRYFIKNGWEALLIEPNKVVYNELQQFYADNEAVEVLQLAINNQAGTVKLDVSKRHWALSEVSDNGTQIVGQVTPLEALKAWSKYPCEIGIMSIDTEGLEIPILKKMLEEEVLPQILVVEALSGEIRDFQIKMLADKYEFVTTKSLSNIFLSKELFLF